MKLFNFLRKKENAPTITPPTDGSAYPKYSPYYESYDGEKLDGDLGAPKDYLLDHENMAARAWQAFIDSDFVSIVLERYLEWVIGEGLTLQANPDYKVLNSEGVNVTKEQLREFASIVESKFRLWANTTLADYRGLENLHKISIEVLKTAFLTGDCLVIYRITDDGLINVDYINGQDIQTPIGVAANNEIINGVELNERGEHVAYWVRSSNFEYKRIPARDQYGRIRAELVCWKKAKRSDVRGLSAMHAAFQKIRNLDRFTEATIQGAVTQANIAYFVTTDKDAMTIPTPGLRGARTAKTNGDDDVNMAEVKRKVFADTAKTIHELPPGKHIEMPDPKGRVESGEFVKTYFNQFCAGLGIPPEVALQLYTNSFSASRMATKSWEHTLRVKRKHLTIYKTAYELFVDVQVSAGKIDMPELKKVLLDNNRYLFAAFTKCKLMGANVPHADPVKEANGIRILLGDDNVPLITGNGATESLGTGDYDEIIEARKREMQDEVEFKTADNNNNINTNNYENQ